MIEELAVVVKIENHQVWVEGGQASACGGCQQKASCTTNALGSVLKKRSVPVDNDMPLKLGDTVIVAIDENLLLRASLLLYLMPLIALFIGAGIADGLLDDSGYADLWIAGSAVFGFLLSLWLINKMQKLLLLSYYARPVVVKKVSLSVP
ncbi:MAG: SoxR reducing system RseC family protein [Methylovulum sp.]|uniref:SoxR reducing system RseC family protein n=1 Tax=Methylovulum sp. TaxID=1916980 RepID=UPI0026256BB8|nr:SoxR reducing system RseC family protein [Methylovulum sp.]MDD2722896.1 SoxR reducing system RseC family protein [Methylovulum sp.]MDD5124853.1 SoxR reducing system RseC family protein [Methylovulum sp.]